MRQLGIDGVLVVKVFKQETHRPQLLDDRPDAHAHCDSHEDDANGSGEDPYDHGDDHVSNFDRRSEAMSSEVDANPRIKSRVEDVPGDDDQ